MHNFNESSFVDYSKKHLDLIAQLLFSQLKAEEILKLNLNAEESLFIRFNANKVRQNTFVEQSALTIELIRNGRACEKTIYLGLNPEDEKLALSTLHELQHDIQFADVDSHLALPIKSGESFHYHKAKLKVPNTIIDLITSAGQGLDLTGLWASGPQIIASYNSLGTRHFFATDTFFFDYSLFLADKAVKGTYAGRDFDFAELKESIRESSIYLEALKKPVQSVPKGKYRVYLAPAAVAEVTQLLSWGAFSQEAFQRGMSPFNLLGKKECSLNQKVEFIENFELGMTPQFNSLGEISPLKLPIIAKGEITHFLTNSRTAKEFKIESNQADLSESPRSLEIKTGNLENEDIFEQLGTGLYLSNLHYLNWSDRSKARITGMTRYACLWVENGEIKGPIKDLRFDVSLYDILGSHLVEITKEAQTVPQVGTYFRREVGGQKLPGLIVDDFTFTL